MLPAAPRQSKKPSAFKAASSLSTHSQNDCVQSPPPHGQRQSALVGGPLATASATLWPPPGVTSASPPAGLPRPSGRGAFTIPALGPLRSPTNPRPRPALQAPNALQDVAPPSLLLPSPHGLQPAMPSSPPPPPTLPSHRATLAAALLHAPPSTAAALFGLPPAALLPGEVAAPPRRGRTRPLLSPDLRPAPKSAPPAPPGSVWKSGGATEPRPPALPPAPPPPPIWKSPLLGPGRGGGQALLALLPPTMELHGRKAPWLPPALCVQSNLLGSG